MASTQIRPVEFEPGAQRMGLTHLAISLGSEAAVDALTAQLRANGVPVLDGPRRTGDGYYESVVLDPDGNRIEITA
jgi:lactoylglutathione lyase